MKETELDRLRAHIESQPRDLLLFELALNTSVPVQELLRLKISDVEALKPGDQLPFGSSSMKGSQSDSSVTPGIYAAIRKMLRSAELSPDDYLFKSRKGNRPLSVQSVSRIIRSWREKCGLTHVSGLPGIRMAQREIRSSSEAQAEQLTSSELPVLPRVQSLSVQEIVYQELESAILSGKIAPGQKIVTEEISRMMDVSRIPVREAMGRLEARGLISTKPKWGSVVSRLSRENLKEISDIRLLLEPLAGAKAAALVDEPFLTELEEAHRAFAEARRGAEAAALLRTNREFHFLIYEQGDSPMLLELITHLWNRVSPYYHIMFNQSLERSPTIGVSYHEHIYESLMNRDAKSVEHWLRADIVDSTGFILKLFDI